jgi:hypothetical protein
MSEMRQESDAPLEPTRYRVDSARSIYHGCHGMVVGRSTAGVQLELLDPPEGWPARVWFDCPEIEETP